MSFRQALSVVWRQRVLIIVLVLIAMGVATVFLVRQNPVYTSTLSARLSTFAATASASGQIGTATVDFAPDAITSPTVLRAAATRIGEPPSATASWNVQYTSGQSQGSSASAAQLTISAQGSTAAQAQKRTTAVETAYNNYLVSQTAQARTAAEQQVAKWTAQAQADQALVDKNPTNSIAQSSLSAAISSLSNANTTISQIDSAGPPVIVSKAAEPGEFQGTSTPVALAVALIAGLIAGIGIALIRDAFDDRLRPDDDVEELTGVPPLGELSLDRVAHRGRDRLPAAGRERTTLNEGLRSLRTTVQVLLPTGPGVLVVTSVEPGDGKTFISSNLALAWARMGRQVVLIGGDLRKAGLEQYFGDAATGPGFASLLESAARTGAAPTTDQIAAALKPTPYGGLSVLPSGDEPWDPSDLLALDAVGDIIARLRGMCDLVIIDSPPSLALVDARLLASHADGVIVVASMRRTRRTTLAETVQALTGSGNPVLGVVLNRSKRALPKSYSAYYGVGRRATPSSAAADERSVPEQPEYEIPAEAPVPATRDGAAAAEPGEGRPDAVEEPSLAEGHDRVEPDLAEEPDTEPEAEADIDAGPEPVESEQEAETSEQAIEGEQTGDEPETGSERDDPSAEIGAHSPPVVRRSPRTNRRVRTRTISGEDEKD